MQFIDIETFIEQYLKDVKKDRDADDNYHHPRLFVWESFKFCNCECPYMDKYDYYPLVKTLKKYVNQIAVNRRMLKQRDYHNCAYYVNDYYFTLKANPEEIFALYTNILLSEWFRGKWHRGVETITTRLLCLPATTNFNDYIIPDTYKDFKIKSLCNEYYDRATLIFPTNIETAEESFNEIADKVAVALEFSYDTDLDSGK